MNRLFALLLLSCLPWTAYAESVAYTVRPTEIKQQPYSDAASIATLPEKASVNIVLRKGGWVNISSPQGNGWVKMLNLRSTNTSARQGDSGLQSLFNMGRSGSSGITVATGVRGLSEEDLKNAQPNPAELAKLKGYAVDRRQAEKFGSSSKLKTQTLDYVPAN
jgi:uncharacterized protein YraI